MRAQWSWQPEAALIRFASKHNESDQRDRTDQTPERSGQARFDKGGYMAAWLRAENLKVMQLRICG